MSEKVVVHVHAWGLPYYVGRDKSGKYIIEGKHKLKRISHFSSSDSARITIQRIVNNDCEAVIASIISADKWNCGVTMREAESFTVAPVKK